MKRFVWVLVITSSLGFGASKPLPSKKSRHKRKSLTTAQLYKKGPFLGGATVGAVSQTVF
ncbi:MAG: hypothetical protein EBQ92_05460 [Proteobacteria bacterium]|nr:hypothetical protein [Pseudomonadota bacterium]